MCVYVCMYTHTYVCRHNLCCVKGLQTAGKTIRNSFKKVPEFADIIYGYCYCE